LVLNVVEGEKAEGKTEKWKLHSKKVPKTEWRSNSTGSWAVAGSSGIEVDFKGDKHEKVEKRSSNMV
jgi:hypothetical protein